MFCIKFELNVMHVVGQISWVTSIENSDMLMLRGVTGQNGNANNWCCIVGQCLMQCWPLYSCDNINASTHMNYLIWIT